MQQRLTSSRRWRCISSGCSISLRWLWTPWLRKVFYHNVKQLFPSLSVRCEVIWELIGGLVPESSVKYIHAFTHTQAHAHKAFHREAHRGHSVSSWMVTGPAVKAKAWNSMAVKCVSLWLLSSDRQQRGEFAEALHSVGPDGSQTLVFLRDWYKLLLRNEHSRHISEAIHHHKVNLISHRKDPLKKCKVSKAKSDYIIYCAQNLRKFTKHNKYSNSLESPTKLCGNGI